MRVIGGELRSRQLLAPPRGVRPTSDRVREALFGRLGSLAGSRVLDLYAGTGALGIEALSRGAEGAVFVEHADRSLAVLRRNLASLGLEQRARVLPADVAVAARRLGKQRERFDLVLLDPPYAADDVPRALEAVCAADLLGPEAVVVVESAKRHPWHAVAGLRKVDERDYGDTRVTQLVAERAQDSHGG